jgi:DNA-nicking Smr family endonuclease
MQGNKMSGKKKLTEHQSLNQLEEIVRKAGIQLESAETPISPPARDKEKTKPVISEISSERADEDVFAEAMNGIERVAWKHELHPSSKIPRSPVTDSDSEARRLMQEAVDGNFPIPIPDHPEYIEGWIGVAGKRFLPNLRNGLYSIQGQIDLHGYNQADAQIAVEDYIIRMSRFRPCCIKIIHGRGINSLTDRATLKESLQRLLSTRRMARYVVAYASAPSRDGGVGAVYVLLSRS